MAYGGLASPENWLFCDGTEVRISDYLNLYNAIQYQFKDQSQVASGFFGLPDFRGKNCCLVKITWAELVLML